MAKRPEPERHKQHGLNREWKVPYGLEDPDTPPLTELIEEWDNDRIDDRDLIEFFREVAKIPVPEEIAGMAERLTQSGWDLRLWSPVHVARAAVWAYDELEKLTNPAGGEPGPEYNELVDEELSPKVVLNAAIIWDRG